MVRNLRFLSLNFGGKNSEMFKWGKYLGSDRSTLICSALALYCGSRIATSHPLFSSLLTFPSSINFTHKISKHNYLSLLFTQLIFTERISFGRRWRWCKQPSPNIEVENQPPLIINQYLRNYFTASFSFFMSRLYLILYDWSFNRCTALLLSLSSCKGSSNNKHSFPSQTIVSSFPTHKILLTTFQSLVSLVWWLNWVCV